VEELSRVGYIKARLFHSYGGRRVGVAHPGRDMTGDLRPAGQAGAM